ncbi:MAG: hypothetical protein ABSE46_15520 [Terracidiphilus sp.]
MKRYVGTPIKRGFALSLLCIFGDTVSWIYKMAFGGLDEIAYRRSRKKFIAEVRRDFSDLPSQHRGRIAPDEGIDLPRSFDYVAVTVEFKEVRFRIIRGRGELRVEAAAPSDPQDWQDLSLLWTRKAMRNCGSPPSPYDQLGDVAQRLDNNWDQLLAALAAWQ